MRKGALVLIPFPFTDLSGQKMRPALVLHLSAKGENCIVAFITSVPQKKAYTFDVPVPTSKQNGLLLPSTIKQDNIATLQKKTVIGELGAAESSIMREVDKRLRALLGL